MKFLNTKKIGDLGKFGEDAAVEHLKSLGYEIVDRNIVCNGHEIDIIVKDLKYIVFVEVKTRTLYHGLSRFGSAASAVDNVKRSHIISASQAYLKEKPHRRVPRYDVIEVYVERVHNKLIVQKINHIPRAFVTGRQRG